MVKAVSLKSTITDWKDERVVLGEDEFDSLIGRMFEVIDKLEKGEEGRKDVLQEEMKALEEVDLGRAGLLDAKLKGTEAAIDERISKLGKEEEDIKRMMQAQEANLAESDKHWEEVGQLPELLKKLGGLVDLATWKRKIDKAEHQKNEVAEQAELARKEVADLRTTFHFLLHKVAYVSSVAERLSNVDSRKRRREETVAAPSKK
eukprot:TRINITY_DN10020_c0_g2_i1.p1 TRINITY_DN10020_c0_g2~~TRINITY_DN10020_c0_g2_i1.p1  ORF type:complete len:204 (+),score=92.18 TRINITY_DN10020_c0_g2_i1:34-645(+)